MGSISSRFSRANQPSSCETSRAATPCGVHGPERYWNYPASSVDTGTVSGPEGAVLYEDGSCYFGPLSESRCEGFGVWIACDGSEIEGTWKNGELEGSALVVKSSGARFVAKFKHGELVSESEILGGKKPLTVVSSSPAIMQPNASSTSLGSSSSSSEDVHKWLTDIHMAQYEDRLNESGPVERMSKADLDRKLKVSSIPFGHRTRLMASFNSLSTPPPMYPSTSSSVSRIFVPRPPSRAETWLIPFDQLVIEQRLIPGRPKACPNCSAVYRGSWLGKEVVIRIFQTGTFSSKLCPNAMDLLSRMARIRHPNIALFMAASLDGQGKLALVTELVVNGSVDQFLASGSKSGGGKKQRDELTAQNILHLAKGIAIGCAYLRKQGFAHKNLKPSNVLIDASIDVKLTDYFVKEFNELFHPPPCTAAEAATVAYVAPESLRTTPFLPYGLDSASDVYSFGMILWEMLSGRRPYVGLSRAQIRVLVGYGGYREQPVQVATLRGISRLVERCIAQEPSRRTTFERLVVALNSMHSSANSAAEDALITFISGR